MKRFALSIAALLTMASAASAAVIVDDKFNDGSAANGTDITETDTTWSAFNANGTVTIVGGADSNSIDGNTLRIQASGGNTRLVGTMPAITLASAGDSITLAADYRYDSTYTVRSVRFGLENFTAPVSGYAFSFAPGGASTIGGEIYRYQALVGGGNNNGTEGGNSARFETTDPENAVHRISLSITRLANDGLELTAAASFIAGGSATLTTLTPVTYTFDRISVRFDNVLNGNTGPAYFDNISLTTGSAAVPEPATMGLAMMCGAFMLQRRRPAV